MRALASKLGALKERDRASTPIPAMEDDSDEEYVQRPAARNKRKVHHTRWADREDRVTIKRSRISDL
jgi:hypothetical protein